MRHAQLTQMSISRTHGSRRPRLTRHTECTAAPHGCGTATRDLGTSSHSPGRFCTACLPSAQACLRGAASCKRHVHPHSLRTRRGSAASPRRDRGSSPLLSLESAELSRKLDSAAATLPQCCRRLSNTFATTVAASSGACERGAARQSGLGYGPGRVPNGGGCGRSLAAQGFYEARAPQRQGSPCPCRGSGSGWFLEPALDGYHGTENKIAGCDLSVYRIVAR